MTSVDGVSAPKLNRFVKLLAVRLSEKLSITYGYIVLRIYPSKEDFPISICGCPKNPEN